MKELVSYIAKGLVDNPDQVTVNEVEGEHITVIELKVAKNDMGKLIGRQGKTARALRTLVIAAAVKQKKKAVLEILD